LFSTNYCVKTASKQNPKFEARNPKQTAVKQIQNRRKFKTPNPNRVCLGFWSFEFVSYFGFRVSNLRLLPILRALRGDEKKLICRSLARFGASVFFFLEKI